MAWNMQTYINFTKKLAKQKQIKFLILLNNQVSKVSFVSNWLLSQ